MSFFESSGKKKMIEDSPKQESAGPSLLDRLKAAYHEHSGIPREEDMPWADKNVDRLMKRRTK